MSKTAEASLPTDAAARKALPIFSGVLRYFPDALAAVAEVSRIGNEQHNPGQPLHWAKEKSRDEYDALTRHLVDVGTIDSDGVRHAAKVAWRALAGLQREIERERGYDYDPATDSWRKLTVAPGIKKLIADLDGRWERRETYIPAAVPDAEIRASEPGKTIKVDVNTTVVAGDEPFDRKKEAEIVIGTNRIHHPRYGVSHPNDVVAKAGCEHCAITKQLERAQR